MVEFHKTDNAFILLLSGSVVELEFLSAGQMRCACAAYQASLIGEPTNSKATMATLYHFKEPLHARIFSTRWNLFMIKHALKVRTQHPIQLLLTPMPVSHLL